MLVRTRFVTCPHQGIATFGLETGLRLGADDSTGLLVLDLERFPHPAQELTDEPLNKALPQDGIRFSTTGGQRNAAKKCIPDAMVRTEGMAMGCSLRKEDGRPERQECGATPRVSAFEGLRVSRPTEAAHAAICTCVPTTGAVGVMWLPEANRFYRWAAVAMARLAEGNVVAVQVPAVSPGECTRQRAGGRKTYAHSVRNAQTPL